MFTINDTVNYSPPRALIHLWMSYGAIEFCFFKEMHLFAASKRYQYENHWLLLAVLVSLLKTIMHWIIMRLMADPPPPKKEAFPIGLCWKFRSTVLASDSHSSSYRWWMVVMWFRIEAIAVLLPEEAIIFVSFVDWFLILMPHFCASVSR